MLPTFATLTTAGLLGLLAARHDSSRRAALVSVGLFATMPIVWLALRDGAPQLLLLPFLTAWLLSLNEYFRSTRPHWLAMAAAALASMIYLHLVGLVMAPVYFAIAVAALLARRDPVAHVALFAGACAVTAAPWAIMTLRDPQTLSAPILAYGLYDATRFNPLQGAHEMTSWIGLTVRSEVYWDYLNPALLFLGKGGLISSVLRPEVFILPLAIPLGRGLIDYARRPQTVIDWIVLAAFAAAPVAAALIAQAPVPGRLLLMAPAAAILGTRGLTRRA